MVRANCDRAYRKFIINARRISTSLPVFTVIPTEGTDTFAHVRINEIHTDAAVLARLRPTFIILAFTVVARKSNSTITGVGQEIIRAQAAFVLTWL
jgi:hypothetical protein